MLCPSCQTDMMACTLSGHSGRDVQIDICTACQLFWFDRHESLQLSPAGTLQLFRTIGEHVPARRQPLATVTKCPRCGSRLVPTRDRQRNVPFQYRRCPHDHGRLTPFFDFLREKHFIRPIDPAQLAELRRAVQSVNCSNCGAPINLAHQSACAHCGSPLTMLDVKAAGDLIDQLRHAASPDKPLDPSLPLRLEQARRQVEQSFAAFEREPRGALSAGGNDLISAALTTLARWFTPS
ncbi:MAG: zf-TFIIB domain-containing protein [Vicinamibacterales bacterium]